MHLKSVDVNLTILGGGDENEVRDYLQNKIKL